MVDFAKHLKEMRINKAHTDYMKKEDYTFHAEIPISKKITLPSGKIITLNDQQAAALAKMDAWLDTENDYFFTLSGYAGTGKTTITLELIKMFYAKPGPSWRKRMAVSAPTHKARKVIGKATKEDAYTIQKLLGLRPNTELENFNINQPQFDALAEKAISGLQLLIIDEASMLNGDLFDLIVTEAKNHQVKVLFMGDQAQLPPVNESISRIFTEVANTVQLTKVERQKDSNPLMGVYDLIRSDLKSPVDLFEHITQVNEQGEGIVFYSDRLAFEAHVLPMFASEEYKKDPDYIKMIAYTNASVQVWNKQIRNYVFKNPEETLLEGDILFAYNTVSIDRTELLIENSSDYKVQLVKDGTTKEGIDVWVVTIRSVDLNLKSEINIVKPSGIKQFLSKFNYLHKAAVTAKGSFRKFAWRNYYEFKNLHLLIEDIKDASGKLLVKKDIDYGYAITVHKSQGSTYENIAVTENNLDTNNNTEERNKLKYVAFSRPTTKAIIFSNKA